MPFRRRKRFRRKRRFRRRPRRRRRMSSHLDSEKKIADFTLVNIPMALTGVINHLNNPPQGITENDRIGLQILMLSHWMQYEIKIGVGGGGAPVFCKLWLIYTTQPDGQMLTTADFLSIPVTPTTSPRELDQLGQHKVIWSRRHGLTLGTSTVKGSIFKNFRLKARYNNQSGAIQFNTTGALWLVFVSDAPANEPTITFSSRMRYTG